MYDIIHEDKDYAQCIKFYEVSEMIKNGKVLGLLLMLILLCLSAGACAGKNEKTTDTSSPDTAGDTVSYSDETVAASANVSGSDVSYSFDFGSSPSSSSTELPSLIDYNTTTKKHQNTTTTKKSTSNTTVTTKKSSTTTTSKPVSEMSLKELQMAMFMTDDPTKAKQILTAAGFAYDPIQDIYYSVMNPLQRNFGYNVYYDAMAPVFGMIFDTERIYFSYDDKDWLVQLWKGQYGITVGAEVGIYYKPSSRTSGQYDCISDDDLVEMTMELYKGDEKYFTRGPERHWWLTGFKLLDAAAPSSLSLNIMLTLDEDGMADAFFKAADKKNSNTFICLPNGNDFIIHWG